MAIANPYVTTGYISESYVGARGVLQAKLQEITWDSFAESEYIDRTWDEWFGDAWDFDAVAFSFSTVSKAKGGYLISPSLSLTTITDFDELAGRIASGQGDYTSTSTQTADANKTVGIPATEFTGIALFDGLAFSINFGEADITAISSTSVNGNRVLGRFTPSFTGNFSLSGSGKYLIAAGKASHTGIFSQTSILNYILGQGSASLEAFASELTIGRNVILPDPYYIFKVLQETRQFSVPISTNTIKLLQEIRVNNVRQETRGITVPQETRNYRIFTPPFKNRSSIPKIRGDY